MADGFREYLWTFRERLMNGFLWNAFGALSLQGANLLTTALLVRVLGLQQFGAYQLIIVTLIMVANFAQGGLAFVSTKLIAENLNKDQHAVGGFLHLFSRVTIFAGVVATIFILLCAPFISVKILGKPELIDELYIASISVFFQVSFTYRTGALQGFSAFQELGKATAVSGIFGVFIIYFAAIERGLEGALVGFAIANAMRAIACTISLKIVTKKYDIPQKVGVRQQDYRYLWHLALPAALAGLVTMPALWTVNLSISNLPNGLELVGIFAVAHQIRQAVLYLPTLLNSVSYTVMSRMLSSGTKKEVRSVFVTSLLINVAFASGMSLILAALAGPIIGAFALTPADAILTLRLLAISIIPEMAAISVYQLIQSSGLLWKSLFQIAIPRDALLCVLSILALPQFGLSGAALAYLAAQILGLLATLFTARTAFSRIDHNE